MTNAVETADQRLAAAVEAVRAIDRDELAPSAAEEVREVVKSPESGGIGRGCPGKNLLCNVVTPPSEGGEGYPSPPSGGVGVTLHTRDATRGGDLS